MNEPHTLQPTQFKILLIGDNCTDVYQYGVVDRISPEAPVPVFQFVREEQRPGMAGNVQENLLVLGCTVDFITGNSSIKTRLIDTRSKQQIVRIDQDIISTAVTLPNNIDYDAVVISDYNKGTVSYELMEEIIATAKCPVFVDTKKTDLARLQGAWVKINELEYSKIKSECSGLIITLGSEGAKVTAPYSINVPAIAVEVADVTGAGDTFLAALVYGYLEEGSMPTAIKFATQASAVTVQHMGVYAPTLEEIICV